MSNYHVEPVDRPQALSPRGDQVAPHATRSRASRGASSCATRSAAAMAVWLLEVTAGTIGFLWPNLSGGFGGKVKIGTLDDDQARRTRRLPIADGLPGLLPGGAGLHRPDRHRPPAVRAPARTRAATARRSTSAALYQRCPHLGCKPNPCLKNFWFECPCHGSRYDRLGIKAAGAQYGPAAAEHGPLLGDRRRRRRPDPRHRQDHARPAAGRARPARASSRRGRRPAASDDRRQPPTPAPVRVTDDAPPSAPTRAEERLPATRPAATSCRPSGSPPRRRSRRPTA